MAYLYVRVRPGVYKRIAYPKASYGAFLRAKAQSFGIEALYVTFLQFAPKCRVTGVSHR